MDDFYMIGASIMKKLNHKKTAQKLCLEPTKTSTKMELFSISRKSFILDVWLGSEYIYGNASSVIRLTVFQS